MSEKPDPHKNFWMTRQRQETLRSAIDEYMKVTKSDANEVAGLILGRKTAYLHADKRRVNQIIDGSLPHCREELSGVLDALCGLIVEFPESGARENFENAISLRGELVEFLAAQPVPPPEEEPAYERIGDRVFPHTKAMKTLINLLSEFMKIEWDTFLDAYKIFFNDEDMKSDAEGDVAHSWFELYRYHSDEGSIAKSFVVLSVHNYSFGKVCFFTNYFPLIDRNGLIIDSENDARITRGIVIPTERVAYFVGEIDEGHGLKIMAVNKPMKPQTEYTGLVLSFELDVSSISGRFLMRKSEHQHHRDAHLRIRPDREFRDELEKGDFEKLRHPPKIKAPLSMWHSGEKISIPPRKR